MEEVEDTVVIVHEAKKNTQEILQIHSVGKAGPHSSRWKCI